MANSPLLGDCTLGSCDKADLLFPCSMAFCDRDYDVRIRYWLSKDKSDASPPADTTQIFVQEFQIQGWSGEQLDVFADD